MKKIILTILALCIPALAQQVNGPHSLACQNISPATVLNEGAAFTSTAGACTASLATTSDTTIPVLPVVANPGSSGTSYLADAGVALVVLDNTIASGGVNYYVIASTSTAGYFHAQNGAPSAGTFVLGFLVFGVATSGPSTPALVKVMPFIYGGSGGGGGTYPPGTGIPQVVTGTSWGSTLTTSGTGTVVCLATSCSMTTPILGAASATSVNGVGFTSNATGFTVGGGTTFKNLNILNTLTLAAPTDGLTLNIGPGGTLGTGAFGAAYVLPSATASVLGGVITGSGVLNSSGTISVTPTSIGLSGVTNNAQAYASIYPNTPPTNNYIAVGNGTNYASAALGGDCTASLAGTYNLTCTKSGGMPFGTGAFATISLYAPLVSPALTGVPTAPTASNGTNTTQIATTAFVLANGFTNPMTTLGDVIYGGASGVPTRLAGYTAINSLNVAPCEYAFGGVAQAPSWCLPGTGSRTVTTSSPSPGITEADCVPNRIFYESTSLTSIADTVFAASTSYPSCTFQVDVPTLTSSGATNTITSVTITPGSGTVNGGATLVVSNGSVATFSVDSVTSTNWKAPPLAGSGTTVFSGLTPGINTSHAAVWGIEPSSALGGTAANFSVLGAASETDTASVVNVDTGTSSTQNPFRIGMLGTPQFQVCYQTPGVGAQGEIVIGSVVTCPNIATTPYAKIIAEISGTLFAGNIERQWAASASQTGDLDEWNTATAAGTGFNILTAWTGVTSTDTTNGGGTKTFAIRGDGIITNGQIPWGSGFFNQNGNGSATTGTYTTTLSSGDFGASPVTGVLNLTDTSTSTTDNSYELNIAPPTTSYHNPLNISVDGFAQLQVCNISGSSHIGIIVMGSIIPCASLSTPTSKFWDMHAGNYPTATFFNTAASGFTSNLVQLQTTQAAGTGFNFLTGCVGASATNGTCSPILWSINGNGMFTGPAVTITGATSGSYVKADGTGYGSLGAISNLTAATGSNTMGTNANYEQVWPWLLTSTTPGLLLGETTSNPSTGTGSILQVATVSGSTAIPFSVAATSSSASCLFQILGGASATTTESCVIPSGYTQSANGFTGTSNTDNVQFSGGLAGSYTSNGQAGGGVFMGSHATNAGSATKGGYAILSAGMLTNATPNAAALEGVVQIQAGYLKGMAIANLGDVVSGTTTAYTVTDCALGAANIIGIADTTTNPIGVITDGLALVKFDGATTIGDNACGPPSATGTAGLAHDNGSTACVLGTAVGVIINNSGTVIIATGTTQTATAMSSTLALVQLHISQ